MLEWAAAGDLAALLQQRLEAGQPFSAEQVLHMAQQVCVRWTGLPASAGARPAVLPLLAPMQP